LIDGTSSGIFFHLDGDPPWELGKQSFTLVD
jgi:hypothetical protein